MKFLGLFGASIAALALTAMPAQAGEGQGYGNLGVIMYDIDAGAFGIVARGGYDISQNFAIEAEGSLGVIKDKETIGTVEVKTGVDFSAGAFAVAKAPISENMEIFARGGYYFANAEARSGSVAADVDLDGLAFGGGLQLNMKNNNGIRFEYTRYDEDGGGFDSVAVSYVKKF